MNTQIEVKNLYHNFGSKNVLDGIELQIEKGEIFGLLGPSGAGKTTIINILTGQLNASAGECQISGVDSNKLSGESHKKIGVMMDHFGLYERMTCFDNLRFYEMLDGNKCTSIDSVLSKVGLLESKKVQVINLSKGMKNRLSFARAILRSPEILFLDEPTSGLDPNTAKEIHKMILEEKKRYNYFFDNT